MKELSIEEKAKRYDEAYKKVAVRFGSNVADEIFPELKESEGERIRKRIIHALHGDVLEMSEIKEAVDWLEKQGGQSKKVSIWKHWKDGIAGNGEGKPIYLIKDGYTYSINSCLCFECDYIELSELDKLLSEKQGEQNPVEEYNITGISSKHADGKLGEMIENMESANKVEPKDYRSIDPHFFKPADKVEPKYEESKTKIFDAPTPFEDKLYAFVAACEFLTLPAKIEFIKEHSQELLDAAKEQIEKEETEWTKEDERLLNNMVIVIQDYYNKEDAQSLISWLKSLKTRYTWKPSDEQMEVLLSEVTAWTKGCPKQIVLESLYNDLQKLK